MLRRRSLVLFLLLISSPFVAFSATSERVVDLTAADGLKLKGTFFSAGKPGPGVLLLHQCNKDRKIWDGLARELASAGINVMTMDLRNFGESGGKPQDKLTPQENQEAQKSWPSDIDKAYEYLLAQPGVKREAIGIGGASCGFNNSVQTAMRHPKVKSLVLLAGTTNVKGREFLREAKIPIFFGYADDDEFPATIRTTQWLYGMASNRGNRLVHYDKGGHGAEIFDVHPEFKDVIRDWFVTTLVKTPGRAPKAERVTIPPNLTILDEIDRPGGAAKVSKMLKDARAKDPKATLFPEDVVNIMGYEHMQAGDKQGAIDILKLNADAYPDSANVYDSLSDAYLAAGQNDLARENAKKTLEMLPKDTKIDAQTREGLKGAAEAKLKQLGDTPQ